MEHDFTTMTTPLASPAAAPERSCAPPKARDPGFALYVHWPFCRHKCPYCDFNSHVRAAVDQPRWRQALLAELDHFGARTEGRALRAIFFGGGTPSLMPAETVAALIARAREWWRFEPEIEITLEANPTSVEATRFEAFAKAGVNRLSLGVQALKDSALHDLGRQHGVAEALHALDLAREIFPRVSFDLIYARPGQSLVAWKAELQRALDLAIGHLSLYQLTIEPGTHFFTLARQGRLDLPDEDLGAALFDLTQELCEAAGLPAYEISNHARPGEESRHNLVYWRYGDYVGIGPGAHGRLRLGPRRVATRAQRLPERWLEAVTRFGHGQLEEEELAPADQATEYLLMGMRLSEGVELSRLAVLAGRPWDAFLDVGAVRLLETEGLLQRTDGHLRTTATGRRRLDAVIREILR